MTCVRSQRRGQLWSVGLQSAFRSASCFSSVLSSCQFSSFRMVLFLTQKAPLFQWRLLFGLGSSQYIRKILLTPSHVMVVLIWVTLSSPEQVIFQHILYMLRAPKENYVHRSLGQVQCQLQTLSVYMQIAHWSGQISCGYSHDLNWFFNPTIWETGLTILWPHLTQGSELGWASIILHTWGFFCLL